MQKRKLAIALAGVAATAALITAPVQAVAASAPAAVSGDYYFTGEYYTYLNDCKAVGAERVRLGWIAAYACLNGSPAPWDDYELWVRN
ncbi:hypothetical protein GCM10029976_076860 [Kribbella albertanoniae]|uniref:Uncharacterized protein n=1 Tax=Kribbella albertanoniae TaxID=1266829 RepID=A0A4R4Q4N0_9ACTN|nr:hypothetical protein [Kribbella albertanoniae]TDC30024.1 hypothetical protein E1261_14295 [Kribbella albertanoniae]